MRCFEGRRGGLEVEESSPMEREAWSRRSCRNLTDMGRAVGTSLGRYRVTLYSNKLAFLCRMTGPSRHYQSARCSGGSSRKHLW